MKSNLRNRLGAGGLALAASLIMTLALESTAQVYPPPTAVEYAYPSGIANGRTRHSSSFLQHQFALAAWDEPSLGGMVIWQIFTAPGSTTVMCSGTVNYPPGTRDLEVGLLHYGSMQKAFVAYHRQGVGHMLDQYDWNPATCTFTLTSTTALSAHPKYTRISMDSHKSYGLAIVWQEQTVNPIKTRMYYSNGTTIFAGFTHSLLANAKHVQPDVAFSHGNDLFVHFVYYDASTNDVFESKYPYWTLYGWGAPTVFPPIVEDIQNVPLTPGYELICHLDGPDHGPDNWAYTYTHDQKNIYVRLADYPSGTLTTVVMNDGSLGNVPINGFRNIIPVLAYSPSPGDEIMVGWYTAQLPSQSFVAAGIKKDGSALVTALDYLQIPNNPSLASPVPVLSFSKMTETTPHNYAFYPELVGGLYNFKHKYHNFSNFANYKTGAANHNCEEHLKDRHIKHPRAAESSAIVAYPNPFTNSLSVLDSRWSPLDQLEITLMDLSGRVILSAEGSPDAVNAKLQEQAGKLSEGAYLIKVLSLTAGTDEVIKVHKID